MTPLDVNKMHGGPQNPGGPPYPVDPSMPGYPPMGQGEIHTTPASGAPWFPPDQGAQYGYGQGAYPQGGYPQGGYPPMQGGYPPPDGSYGPPQGGYYGNPPGGYPAYTSPPQGYTPPTGPYVYSQPNNETVVMSQYRSGQRSDIESNSGFTGFSDSEVRRAFVKKVYLLLSIQLVITAIIVYPFLYVESVQEFADDHWYLLFVFLIGYMIISCAIVCIDSLRRTFPINLIMLTFMTIVMGCALGFITSRYNTTVVLIALGMTGVICLTVTLVAWLAPIDVTGCGMVLCLCTCGLGVFGMVASVLVIFFQMKILILIYSGIAVALFSIWLLYDTQQIMGGKRIELSPEEYILGTMQLYIDIVQIFMNLLPLVAACFGGGD